MVKANGNNSTSNRQTYNNPNIGDGAANNGRLSSHAYQYATYTAQELLTWNQTYGKHNVDVLAGHENYSWERKLTRGMNTNMAVSGNLVMGNFLTNSYFDGFNDVDRLSLIWVVSATTMTRNTSQTSHTAVMVLPVLQRMPAGVISIHSV